VLKGSYPASPTKFLQQMLEALKSQDARMSTRGVPFVETTVYRLAASVYHRARTYQNPGVLAGYVGTGKTTAAREYARRTANVFVIECMRNMSSSAFLDDLCSQLSLTYEARGASKERKFIAIVRALKGSESLLIVDEADTVNPETLHYVRRVRDMSGVGVVLQGTENLLALIKPEHGRFDQIRSRIGFWPETIRGLTRQDADEIALAAFEDQEVSDATLDAMWQVCAGSARLLTEALIPAIRDYGLRRGRSLDAALVIQVATEALRIAPRAKPRAGGAA
jgi:DNA transposition AAA+ family ATPase